MYCYYCYTYECSQCPKENFNSYDYKTNGIPQLQKDRWTSGWYIIMIKYQWVMPIFNKQRNIFCRYKYDKCFK